MSELPRSENFVHLHNHTEYSMLDGAARITDMFATAQEMGMPAIATTDHGYLFGAHEFWKTAQSYDVKPIIGLEAYVAPGHTSRKEKTRVKWGDERTRKGDDVSGGGAYTHMTLLARNNTGMHNLFRMDSMASLDSVYAKWPRLDRELLSQYGEGLIATTGCPSGEIQTRLRLGQYDEAIEAASEFRDIFGKDYYFLELMDHGNQIERRVREDLMRLAKDLQLPLLATNDLHYVKQEDYIAQDALLCINSGSTLLDPDRFSFEGDGYYLKSPAEMRRLWRELPEACDNTLRVADMCEVSFTEGEGRYMPRFDVPEGEDEHSWFVKEVQTGLSRRFPDGIPEYAQQQADYEVGVIAGKGYPGYFLVVADFINWAKDNGIRVGPGRGSGAGSMCAYSMGITDLDPVPHGLIFERFLNPERQSMPDFDVDFDERRRSEVIQYVTDKYGDDRVAMIATYGTIKAKQAVKDAARVMGHPFSVGEQLTKAMPADVMGKGVPLNKMYDPEHDRYNEGQEFRDLVQSEKHLGEIVETAKGLEGLKRQWGVHAAGVIMSSEPLIDVIPIMRRLQDGQVLTQFDYPTCETLGLVKMDFLGLRNLTILDDALINIKSNRDEEIDLDALSKDMTDQATYRLLGRGDTLGVFQLDGGGMRTLLRLMQPDNFEDISAALALYRPGPMGVNAHTNFALRKNGRQEVVPLDPQLKGKLQPQMVEALEPILGTTHGLCIYQEQVMEIAQKLAGYSLGNADLLRRAMGKKKKEVLDKEYVPFSEGMKANGYNETSVAALWGVLVPFSDYAFNKAHTAAYGLVSYWTAYLKANYPAEYMAALLTSVGDDKDKSALYLNECRRMGINVLPPSVNESEGPFAAVGEDIRFGLLAIRNVGRNVVEAIIATREEKGAFVSFDDFLAKCPAVVCNKRTIESLIMAGAFDDLDHPRQGLVMVHEEYVEAFVGVKRQEAVGQDSLWDMFGGGSDGDADAALGSGIEGMGLRAIPDVEWDKKAKLANERDMLGLYVSDHPLFGVEHVLQRAADTSIATLTQSDNGVKENSHVTIAGLVTGLSVKRTKKGDLWAIATVEDLEGAIECLFFPKTYLTVQTMLTQDIVAVVRGRVNVRDDSVSLYAEDLKIPELTDGPRGPVVLTLDHARATSGRIEEVKQVLSQHPGSTDVQIKLVQPGRSVTMSVDASYRVEPSEALIGDLKVILGARAVSA
ncbi:DNA polymerase III subunit alpha [Janibacter cremeus]|uniref:DNA polymerase III subunit alpha n=1 Tax=Janibacter cremeus TaxID=1285192 RepID=A0A852VTW0_9MICO|nr:DNA polymerase III subunit alpha [Janibacter cremeus]NYF97011.1 DNA polymerase-3 subunit alpha [Janibacter cremeus]